MSNWCEGGNFVEQQVSYLDGNFSFVLVVDMTRESGRYIVTALRDKNYHSICGVMIDTECRSRVSYRVPPGQKVVPESKKRRETRRMKVIIPMCNMCNKNQQPFLLF